MTVLTALNGRLPASSLVLIERGQSLRFDAAASWHRMEAAGMPKGCLRSGYRDLALQGVLVISGATIARPGTSYHGEGTAADVDEPARTWVRAHGAAYGWAKDHVPREPWHMEFDPARDQHAATPTPVPVIPAPAPTTHPGGFLMALTDQQQTDLAQRVQNVEAALTKFWDLYGADDRRNRVGEVDDTHDKVLQIHNGVSTLTNPTH